MAAFSFWIRKSLFVVGLLMLTACAATAHILYPVNDDPLESKSGAYKLDPTHANIIFAVNHLGFSLHYGRFNQLEGSLALDTKAPESAELYIKIHAASIDTNNGDLDNQLRAVSMLNTAEFPFATFESKQIKQTTEKAAIVEGWLTLKGHRQLVQIKANFVGSGTNPLTGQETIGFNGSATIQRSDFGLKEWLPLVGNQIDLILEAEFVRAKN